MIDSKHLSIFEKLVQLAEKYPTQLYLVGGYVRDILLGRELSDKDIDILVEGDAIKFAELAQQDFSGSLRRFKSFGTAKLVHPTKFPEIEEIDFAGARKEIYEKPGKLPVVSPSNINDDLSRRDFTINAMAVNLKDLCKCSPEEISNIVIDNFSGREDLKNRSIRILHEKSFIDDPTRIYRAIRYMARINGNLDGFTEKSLKEALHSGALNTVSTFRKFTELRKIVEENDPVKPLQILLDFRVLDAAPVVTGVDFKTVVNDIEQKYLKYEDRGKLLLSIIFKYLPADIKSSFAKELNLSKQVINDFYDL